MKWFPVQWSAQEAQLLESIELSNVDVAHAFNVPPAVLGLHDSVSYGSAQQAAADLVQNALAPLASRIEQAMARCLLTPAGRAQYLIEHDLSGLLRGDQSARWATYKVGREIGAISSEEVRRFENLGPKNAGEDYAPVRSTSGAASSEPVASAKP
jgi:HK97 family phage portal protein